MSKNDYSHNKTIQEAVADGILVEVTDVAKGVGIPYRTFMTPTLIARCLDKSSEELREILSRAAWAYHLDLGWELYGPSRHYEFTTILEPHEEFGHILLVMESEAESTLTVRRSTGDSLELMM